MRIFAPLTLLGCLLASAVPATAIQIPHGLANPFQAYVNPSALYNADTVGAPEDWWREAEAKGYKLRLWVDQELANNRKIAGDGIDQFKVHAADVLSAVKRVGALVAHGDKQEIHDELSRVVEDTLKEMKDTFPPPQAAMGHEARKESVHRALAMAEEKIVDTLKGRVSVDEAVLRQDVGTVCSALAETAVVAGDLVEQHPVLIEVIVIAGSTILGAFVSEWFILRPLIRLLGWGPLGPIKGTPAAWAQRYFWGAAVARGSWYAALQRAGMVGVGWLTRTIGGLVGGLVGAGSAWSCFGGR